MKKIAWSDPKRTPSEIVSEGNVMVLPFQGPARLGMPEILPPTDAIKGAGYKRVALITDGRFSGATTGPCIGHVEMEAYNGGEIGAIKDASEGQKKDHTRRKGDEKNVRIS